QVDDVEAQVDGAGAAQVSRVGGGEVHLQVARHVAAVGRVPVLAQPASVDEVAGQFEVAKPIGGAGRGRHRLAVVQVDVVGGDVVQVGRIEVELAGDDVTPLRLG